MDWADLCAGFHVCVGFANQVIFDFLHLYGDPAITSRKTGALQQIKLSQTLVPDREEFLGHPHTLSRIIGQAG